MKAQVREFRLRASEPYYRQIEQHIRGLIGRGDLKVGEKLPPMRELAEWYGVDISTVQPAMAKLARQKLIVRHPRRGTFVNEAKPKLTSVLYYDVVNDCHGYPHAFSLVLGREVRRLLDLRGLPIEVWSDSRPHADSDTPPAGLAEALRQGRFQGIVAPTAQWNHVRWLAALKTPCVFVTGRDVPNRVTLDNGQFADASVRALADQGCRSIGMITPTETDRIFEGKPVGRELFQRFVDVTGDLGIAVRSEWVRTARQDMNSGFEQERFGYDQFQALWRLPERPEGLIVCPDSTARGVIAAMLECGVKTPRDIRILLQRNVELPLLCPMEATYALLSIRECAETMLRILDQIVATDRDVPPIHLPFAIFRP
ncbi:MAG: GntR family transcriptional regulator [Kiritimatiellae bacterium]|nr:GntR family transcriptional regulator [Kiritimatiellia bacterium]